MREILRQSQCEFASTVCHFKSFTSDSKHLLEQPSSICPTFDAAETSAPAQSGPAIERSNLRCIAGTKFTQIIEYGA
jgi:hypothetical protein